MFHKLRIKLTLINASIIVMLFMLLIVGAYWLSKFDMEKREDHMARKIMEDIQAGILRDIPQHHGELPDFPPGLPPGPPPGPPPNLLPEPPPGPPFGQNIFFVKTAPSNEITFQSSGHLLKTAFLAALTKKVLQEASMQGTIMFNQTQYFYLKAPQKNQLGMIVLFRDLSQERNMQRTLMTALIAVGIVCSLLSFGTSFFMANRAMIPIKKAWKQQKEFISDVSHELRTPLAIIQTNLDVVRRNPHETVFSQNKWLDNIQDECIYMAKLVESLLFLARADSQQQLINKQFIAYHNVILQAAMPFQPIAAAKEILLEVAANHPIHGYGDELQIKQVIGILLDNAIRYTSQNGKILVSLLLSEERILVSVADSGEGIEQEYLDKIFERFYQVDTSRSRGGAGLGLSIAKCIIESHGGAITVASSPGRGTTFNMWFPLEKIINCNAGSKF